MSRGALAILALLLAMVGAERFARGQAAWEYAPYRVRVRLALEAVPQLPPAIEGELKLTDPLTALASKKLKGVCFCGAGATYGNASTRMSTTVPSSGVDAYGGWPDVDELYKKQLTETDPEKREAMLHEIQKILHERTRFAPIWDYFWPSGVGPRVADAALMKIDPFPWSAPLEDVQLKRP